VTVILTSFSPVISSTTLTKDEVVRAEKSSKRTRTDGIHGSRFQIDQNGAWNIFVCTNLVVVNGDTLKLEIIIALVLTVALDTVFVRNNLPKFSPWIRCA